MFDIKTRFFKFTKKNIETTNLKKNSLKIHTIFKISIEINYFYFVLYYFKKFHSIFILFLDYNNDIK